MNMTLQSTSTYVDAPNRVVRGANGVDYAYRELGDGAIPIVLLQHFRGNLDNWDPPLIDALAANHRVITFDNVGVGGSSGVTPGTVAEMARDAITFFDAMELDHVDLLGFSIGSFVAQEIALVRPGIVRRMVLASSAPEGADGMHGWAPEVIAAVGQPQPDPNGYLSVFFAGSEPSRQAGHATLQRISGARSDARDALTTWQTRQAQYDAVCTWGIPDHARLERLQRDPHAGVRGQRRQRSDDPAALLLSAGRSDPASAASRSTLTRLTGSCSSTTRSLRPTYMSSSARRLGTLPTCSRAAYVIRTRSGRTRLRSRREEIPNFVKTLRRCHSTVRTLIKRRAPISAFVRPSRARRATSSS